MNIQNLFSSKERIKMINYIMNANQIRVSQTAKELTLSKGLVSGYFSLLTKEGIMKKTENGFEIAYSPMTKAIKILLNINSIDITSMSNLKPEAIGLYGSYANGTNNKDSDIDIWIKTNKPVPQEKIASVERMISEKLNRETKILVLDSERLEKIKHDKEFYHSLVFGSIILFGENLEA
ncbi:MAG: nucleotidyltransferase domain-containing protein [Nanoarchaeota archaeon]|nr:nucleotidyltransferase domain-containing protein [Nanoarchaeota archaeon]MBU4124103.1 nucleotidyltransferase domain-containing protein [Nanoarchaeota archaeon]